MPTFDLSNDAWTEVVAAGNLNSQEISVSYGIAKVRIGAGDRVIRIGGNEARTLTAPAGSAVSARPDGPRAIVSTGDLPGILGGSSITLSASTIDAAATGVIAQLSTGLTGTLTWSKLSGSASTLSIAASTGAVSISAALGAGNTAVLNARVQNALGDAVEKSFTLTGGVILPTLSALSLSSSSATQNTPATISILGATAGSTIIGTVPDGMTLNSAARTITGTPTIAGTYNFNLTETLAGATNSPLASAVAITVAAASSSTPMFQRATFFQTPFFGAAA